MAHSAQLIAPILRVTLVMTSLWQCGHVTKDGSWDLFSSSSPGSELVDDGDGIATAHD